MRAGHAKIKNKKLLILLNAKLCASTGDCASLNSCAETVFAIELFSGSSDRFLSSELFCREIFQIFELARF